MITGLRLLRNVGQFDSVAVGLPLARIALVYAENGRGKTTLAAIFRSLASGDALPIVERHRLAAPNAPHIVIECDGAPPPAVFENNAWNRTLPNLLVFDDTFVDDNVCSGLAVASEHRQNLHEWILGAQGVTLNRALQRAVDEIEDHNRNLRAKAEAIPLNARVGFSVDEFCALPARADIDAEIQEAQRHQAAARERDRIRAMLSFDPINLPEIDVDGLSQLLARDWPTLESTAAARVQTHLAQIGEGGEAWVASGMQRIKAPSAEAERQLCPFCAQDLIGSTLIEHYRGYFSAAYADLKQAVATAIANFVRIHGDQAPLAFERAVSVAETRLQFWARFADMPAVDLNTAGATDAWVAAQNAVIAALRTKQNSPLERIELSSADRTALADYERCRQEVARVSQSLQQANQQVDIVKERAAEGDPATLDADITRLKAMKARHAPGVAERCADYLAEKVAKTAAELARDAARTALDNYRQTIFPAFQAAINIHLQRFNAGFRL